MKRPRSIGMVAALALLLCVFPCGPALADGGESDTGPVVPETGFLVRHLERVEVGTGEAVVVLDMEGEEHEVTVDFDKAIADVGEKLGDGKTDMVDLAAVPVLGGLLLKTMGFLFRLGRI